MGRPRRPASPDPAELRAEIEAGLRALLREMRMRPEQPTLDDVADEADDIEGSETLMGRWEAALHEQPPNEDELKDFEALLHLFWKPITTLAEKLNDLGKQDPIPDGWEKDVRRLLDVVEGYEDLLLSFESLLHAFDPPAPEKLVDSFEDLLNELQTVLAWLLNVVARAPSRRLVERLCRRIETDATLIGSEEALIKQYLPPSRAFAKSLLLLVRRHHSRVWGLFEPVEKVPDNRRLLTRLENMLHGVTALAESAADVIEPQLPDAPLAIDFEEFLSSFQRTLDHFEQIVKKREPPDRFLARSFENLLRECGHLLGRLETMIEAGPDHPQIKNLEQRLEVYADLLESFETIVAALPRDSLVRSFQELLEQFVKLIRRFAQLVKDDPGDDDEKQESKKSLRGLRDRLKKLLDSLEQLKEKLSPLPDDIPEENEQLLAAMQELDRDYLALAGPIDEEVEDYLASVAEGQRLVSRVALLYHGRRRRPSTRFVRRYRTLVKTQGELVSEAHALVDRLEAPSRFLLDALDDLDTLQARLHERARALAGLAR